MTQKRVSQNFISSVFLGRLALWFIDVTVATCHIHFSEFMSIFFKRNGQNTKISKSAIFGPRRLLGAQSINTERKQWQ